MSRGKENFKPSPEFRDEELGQVARHNIEFAIQTIMHSNAKCSYADAIGAIKQFADFLVGLIDNALKAPGWDEKSGSIPYNHDSHETFDIEAGGKMKKIKMGGEAHLTYAAHVLQNIAQSTLKGAFEELKKQADLLLEERKRNEKRNDRRYK